MQPNTLLEALSRTDAQSRNWPCTHEFAMEFMALMLVYRLNAINDQLRWRQAGAFVQTYLNQFTRSSKPQDACLNQPTKGEKNMLLGKTPEQRAANLKRLQEALDKNERETIAKITEKIDIVKGQMQCSSLIKYRLKDLYDNVLIELKKDMDFRPEQAAKAYQLIYGEKSNESH